MGGRRFFLTVFCLFASLCSRWHYGTIHQGPFLFFETFFLHAPRTFSQHCLHSFFSGMAEGYHHILHCTPLQCHFENIQRYSCTKKPAFLCPITQKVSFIIYQIYFLAGRQDSPAIEDLPEQPMAYVFRFSIIMQQK